MLQLSWWRRPQSWVIIGMIVFALYFCVFNVFRHLNFRTSQFDMGNMDQVLWNTTHGHFFQMTSPINAVHEPRTATHADFLLLAYAPFYALWPDPRTMIILQTLAVASGAWPLFLFARKHVSEKLSGWLALSYLLYPSLQWSIIFDVHAVVLATPLLLWAIWAMTERRWWIYAACLGAALLSKEEVGITVGLLGLYTAWKYRPRWIGLSTAVVGILWTVAMLEIAIPHARQGPGHFAIGYYSEYGGSIGSIAKNILTHPWRVIQPVLSYPGADYVAALLGPVGLLPLFGLPFALIMMPELSVNLLSNNPNLQKIFYQYTAVITPILFAAAAIGLGRITRRYGWQSRQWRAIKIWLVASQIISIFWWSPLPGSRYTRDVVETLTPSPYRQSIATIKTLVKPDDKVAVTNNLAPHFTQREYEWAFPEHLELADVAVVWTTGQFDVVTSEELEKKVMAMQHDPLWRLELHDHDVYFFRKVGS